MKIDEAHNIEKKPELNKKYLRLYGHPLCPFVERVLLVLKAKQLEYQFCFMDLSEKAPWHNSLNGGLVPFLELPDGRIIKESDLICEYLEDKYKTDIPLYDLDPAEKYIEKAKFSKVISLASKSMSSFLSHENRTCGNGPKIYIESLEAINNYLSSNHLKSPYFAGKEHETMTDLLVLPFIHRSINIGNTMLKETYYDYLNFEKLQNLVRWYTTLSGPYKSVLIPVAPFKNILHKNIKAGGPKIPLSYPLDFTE